MKLISHLRMCTVVLATLVLMSAHAAAPDDPKALVKEAVEDITQMLEQFFESDSLSAKEKFDKLYNRIKPVFDFQMLAMGALGHLRKNFSNEQLDEFSVYFSKLLSKTYFDKIEGADISDMGKIQIEYQDVQKVDSRQPSIELADLETLIINEDITIPMVYRLINKNKAGWRVYDIKIEGVSMVANYREQYRSRFNAAPEELIDELRRKVENENN